MTTACIVQARVGSTRLPAKVLKDMAGETVLSHVLRRCAAIPEVDVVVCATVDHPENAPIERIARRCGAEVFRGSETDVLDRYLGAARSVDADVVMRVTSDCPVIDPDLCNEVLHLRRERSADYAANNLHHGFPHGLDCEAFTRPALERAAAEATEAYDREHVSPWMRRHPDLIKANLDGPGGAVTRWRWTLDFPEDLAFFRQLFTHLPQPPAMPRWREIAAAVERNPALAAINQSRHQR